MNINTLNLVYVAIASMIITPYVLLAAFWLGFIVYRICILNKKYTKLRLYSQLQVYPSDFYIDFFNCEVKLIIYFFLLFLLISELISFLGYSIASLLLVSQSSEMPSLHIPLNCTDHRFDLWQFEISYPLAAFFRGTGDAFICLEGILLIALLKFIFIAYQNKNNFRSIKVFLLKCSLLPPMLLAIGTIPQTQILAKLFIPIFGIILLFLLLKHKRRYFLILKWRCDDSFMLQDNEFLYHSKVRRNSRISFNILVAGLSVMIFAMILNMPASLSSMLLTDKSQYVTRTFNFDLNLAFLSCGSQQIIYQIRSVLSTIIPMLVCVGMVIYTSPMIGVSIGILVCSLYRSFKRVDSDYIRLEGNANDILNR